MGIVTDILKDIPLNAVLRERITDYEKKMSVLESENLILKTDNQKLNIDKEQLLQKIASLGKIIHDKTPLIDDNSKNILLLIVKSNNALTTEQISRNLNINLQVATFHLQELETNKFISEQGGSSSFGGEYTSGSWYIEQEGRRYLINNKLI